MRTFEARYSSRCPGCPEGIEPGDEVVSADGAVAHPECASAVEAAAQPPAGSVCPRCFIERSVSGACGCDPD